MTLKNPSLIYLEELLKNKLINPEDYFNRLELAYRQNPSAFAEDEVDYIEKQFKRVGVKFNRDLKAGEANVTSTMNQFVSGLVEGFTTLGWAEDPDTTAESIANKVGHLIGFAPDVVASFLSMGQYVPIAAAKRVTSAGAQVTRKSLQVAGSKAPSFLRKEVGPDTFMLQSIPMKVADIVTENVKGVLGGAAVQSSGFLTKGLLGNDKVRSIMEQSMHLGVALGVSSWKEGPEGMVQSAMHGAVAGAMFGGIGNYVNVAKLLSNPKTRKAGQDIVKGVAKQISDDAAKVEGVDMLVKGFLGAGFQGGMATMQGLPVAEQVYEYLLGGFFGATAKSAGWVKRQRWIMKNDPYLYDLSKSEKEISKKIKEDPEFQALDKADQEYILNRVPLIQQQQFDKFAPILPELIEGIPELKEAARKAGVKGIPTKKELRKVFKEAKTDEATKDIEPVESVILDHSEIKADKKKSPTQSNQENPTPRVESNLNERIDVSIAEMNATLLNKDLNEPQIIKNRDLEIIGEQIRGYQVGKKNDEILIKLNELSEKAEYDINKLKPLIVQEFAIDNPAEFFTPVNTQRLGSYLKLKKNYANRSDLEIDVTDASNITFNVMPKNDYKGDSLGGERPRNKYNQTFGPAEPTADNPKIRLIIRKSYVVEKIEKYGQFKDLKERRILKREMPLDYATKGKNKFKDYLSKEVLRDVRIALEKKGAYIYGGSKDSGVLLVHRFPISDIPGKKNYLPHKKRLEILKDLNKEGYNFKQLKGLTKEQNKARVKEIVSNMYYVLVEAGYINKDGYSKEILLDAWKQYEKEPLYETVQKFNKYGNLAQGADIPLELADFTDKEGKLLPLLRKTDGKFNFIMVEDLPSEFIGPDGKPSISGTDAVVYGRQDGFDAIQTKNFRPADNGFLKLVGYRAPRDGVGNILLKTGTFRATDAMNKFMVENDIHFIVSQSAAKTQLGLKLHKINFLIDKWELADPVIEPFQVKPEELYLNMGVYENSLKVNKRLPILKQIFDKLNMNQLGELGEAVKADYSRMIDESIAGDPIVNKAFREAQKEGNLEYQIPDINDLGLNIINETLKVDINSHWSKQIIKKVLERGQEDHHRLLEEAGSDRVDEQIFGIEQYMIPDILNKLDYSPGAILHPPHLEYINKSLNSYRTQRAVKPTVKHGTEAKLAPRDAETQARHPELNNNTFLLGSTFKNIFRVKVKDVEGDMLLSEAFDTYNSMIKDPNAYSTEVINNYREALDFLTVRSPNTGNGGVRVLTFAGFTERKGLGIVTTSKNDYMLGGADKDADSVNLYQGMPESIKKAFRLYENELQLGETSAVYNFEKPRGIFKDLVKEYDKTGKAALTDLLDPDIRIDTAKMARRGKQNIGFVVDGMVRMQNLADLIQQNNGEISTRSTGNEPQEIIIRLKRQLPGAERMSMPEIIRALQRDSYNITNLMADSANFTEIATANVILNRVWNTYFDIVGGTAQTPRRDYAQSQKRIEALDVIDKLHKNVYKNSRTLDAASYDTIAENYLRVHGDKNVYYSKLANTVLENPDIIINPFRYYFNEAVRKDIELFDYGSYEIGSIYAEVLRDKLVKNPLFKRFGLEDTYRNDIESKLDLAILQENPQMLHRKLMEYQGQWISLRLSERWIREITSREDTSLSTETAENIVKDIIQTTYNIKSFYDSSQSLVFDGLGMPKHRAEVKHINTIIRDLKQRYQKKYPEIFPEIEMLMESWLYSQPILKPATDFQRIQLLDINQANNKVKKQLNDFMKHGQNEDKLRKALSSKAAAYNKYVPKMHFITKSIVMNPKNREKFFKIQHETLLNSVEQISKRIKDAPNIQDLSRYVKSLDEGRPIHTIDQMVQKNSEYYEVDVNPETKKETIYVKKEKLPIPPGDDAKVGGGREELPIPPGDDATVKPKVKPKKKPLDTPKILDKLSTLEADMLETLPQFDFLKTQQEPNGIITEFADREIKRTRDILLKSPDAMARFEELFIDMKLRTTGLGFRLDTLTPKDLKQFNDVLEEITRPVSVIDKISGKFVKKPGWLEQTLNYEVIGRRIQGFDKIEYEKRAAPIVNANHEIKLMNIKLPTSTVELGRQTIDRFDTLQKTQNAALEKKINGIFNYLDHSNPIIFNNKDMLFEAAVNAIEFNGGKYPSYETNKESRKKIEEAYWESARAVEKLGDVKLPLPTGTGEGKDKLVTPQKFVVRIKEDIESFLKDIDTHYIKSRYVKMAKTLKANGVKGVSIRIFKHKKTGEEILSIKGQWKPEKIVGKNDPNYETQQKEMLFLDDVGLIRGDRISLLYKAIDRVNMNPRQVLGEQLPSVNDYRFFKYHMELKDRVQFQHKGIDLNKKLTEKQKSIVKKTVLKEMKRSPYAKYYVGEILQGYWPRLGYTHIAKNIPELERWKKDQIEKQLSDIKQGDLDKLPPHLRMDVLYKRRTEAEAIDLYRDHLLMKFEREMASDVTSGQTNAERQILDLMSQPNTDGIVGDYATGNVKHRGDEFMPFYRKDLDALRMYSTGFFKMHLTNLAGLRTELLLRRFDYVNKGEDFVRNWSNWMRNAFTNMMGMSTYRNLNLHGIQKKDQDFLKEYVSSNFDRSKFKLGSYEKELLMDFDKAIEVNPTEQFYILKRHTDKKGQSNIAAAQKDVNTLKMKRAKDLVEQVNTTGKYGTIYHYLSDEVAVNFFRKVDNAFGNRLFGPLPKDPIDRRYEIIKRVRGLSDLEGKFELLSLLSHPKTAITNMYGGTVNTISDTGWESFRRANNTEWMLQNIFRGARFNVVNEATGKVEPVDFVSRKEIDLWLETMGVYDQMFLDLVSLDRNFGRKNVRKFWEEFIVRVNKGTREQGINTKEAYENLQKKTLKEVAIDMKIDVPIVEFGALPMKWSERKLRGTAFLANYINMHQNVLGEIAGSLKFDSPVLVDYALKGVQASQFLYQATYRPNFANTSLGRVMTRFQPYAWNSIGRRMKLYKGAREAGWAREVQSTKKFQRQFTFDVMSLAMANIFVASIFEYALSPPMSWMQDTAQLIFGDAKDRERAFYSAYPHPVLAPLQIATPPIARFVLNPLTSILNKDFDRLASYQLATYFPFGRLGRDMYRTYNSPSMAVDFMTGMPLHKIAELRKEQREADQTIEEMLEEYAGDLDEIVG